MPPVEFLAEYREGGQTIAAVLRKRFNLPWAQAKRLIERGHVRVAGFACTDPGQRVRARNRVWIREGVISSEGEKGRKGDKETGEKTPRSRDAQRSAKAPPASPKRPAEKKPVSPSSPLPLSLSPLLPLSPSALLYADDALAVVNKPAGLTTTRSAEEADEFGPRGKAFLPKTLADYLPQLLGVPNSRVIPVHRIDRNTSGVVVFARTPDAASHLTRQFRKHTAERRYLALVRGTPKNGRIESVFVRDRGDGRRGSAAASNAEDGKHAVTYVKVLEQFPGFALVECRLQTGRPHQVRIHLGEAGTPLCGERVYDRPPNGAPVSDASGADRPMLHAARLGFTHPQTGERLEWEVPPPADFTKLLEKFRRMNAGSSAP
jgi:23S rRNA pseudouridine1911/1915/1917 synthase